MEMIILDELLSLSNSIISHYLLDSTLQNLLQYIKQVSIEICLASNFHFVNRNCSIVRENSPGTSCWSTGIVQEIALSIKAMTRKTLSYLFYKLCVSRESQIFLADLRGLTGLVSFCKE